MKNVGYVCSGVGFIWLVFQGRRKKNEKDLKELISYVFVGGCTTLINFVIYWFVITMMDQGWLLQM